MDLKSVADRVKERVKSVVGAAKATLSTIVKGARVKIEILIADAKAKLAPIIVYTKTSLLHLIGQIKTIHERPQVKSYQAKLKQRDPVSLGGTLIVAVIGVWAVFAVFADTKPSDDLLFEVVTSDGGHGLVYDAKILGRDGFQDGENKYVVEVDYEVTWKMDQDQALEVMMGLIKKEMEAEGIPEYQIKMALMFGGMSVALLPLVGDKPFKAGDRQKMNDSYTFVKAESGWRLLESE